MWWLIRHIIYPRFDNGYFFLLGFNETQLYDEIGLYFSRYVQWVNGEVEMRKIQSKSVDWLYIRKERMGRLKLEKKIVKRKREINSLKMPMQQNYTTQIPQLSHCTLKSTISFQQTTITFTNFHQHLFSSHFPFTGAGPNTIIFWRP